MEREYIDPGNLNSTHDDFERFRTSSIWIDMLGELHAWVQQIREVQDNSDDEKELYRCQGRIEAISHFQILPDVLMAAIIDSIEDARNEREADSDNNPESLGR